MKPTTRDYLLTVPYVLFVAPAKAFWHSIAPGVLVVLWGVFDLVALLMWGIAAAVCSDTCAPADEAAENLFSLVATVMALPILPVMAVNLYRIVREAFRREVYIRMSLRTSREDRERTSVAGLKR